MTETGGRALRKPPLPSVHPTKLLLSRQYSSDKGHVIQFPHLHKTYSQLSEKGRLLIQFSYPAIRLNHSQE